MKCLCCGKEISSGVFCDICSNARQRAAMKAPDGAKQGGYRFSAVSQAGEVEVVIYQDIGFFGLTAEQFQKDLSEKAKNATAIKLRVNSYGGEVFDGFAIYNLLLDHPAKKTVIVDGVAASISSVISMAADKGSLIMHENAQMMIHDPFVGVIGDADDLRNFASVLDNMKLGAIMAYQRHAKDLSKEALSSLMSKDTWLTAAAAKEKGLADQVVEAVTVDEPPTNMVKVIPTDIKRSVFLNFSTDGRPGTPAPANQGAVMVKCKHCQKEIASGAAFCQHCGKAQAEPVVDQNVVLSTERLRVREITARCDQFKLAPDFRDKLIADGTSIEEASKQIMDKVAAGLKPGVNPDTGTQVTVDEADKFRAHASLSLAVAAGIDRTKESMEKVRQGGEPVSSVHGLIRRVLKMKGVDATTYGAAQLVEAGIRASMAGTGSSDLPYILADVANKSLLKGYSEAPTTFQQWCGVQEVPDFKTVHLVKMSSFSDIPDLPEGMPFSEGKVSDKEETASITTKGKKFTITRKALINDDLAAITRIPMAMSAAVARRQNKDVYDQLVSNSLTGPQMTEDSLYLFDASTHENLIDPSGLPTVPHIGTANGRLMRMKLPKGEGSDTQGYTNLQARYLITGVDNMMTVQQALNTPFDPTATYPAGVYNPFNGKILAVFDAYLQYLLTTASKQYAWYLATDPNQMDTFSMVYLQGNRTPTLRGAPSAIGEALGFSWDIFHDWGIALADWRGMVYNDGADS